jgi:hypothetical protein
MDIHHRYTVLLRSTLLFCAIAGFLCFIGCFFRYTALLALMAGAVSSICVPASHQRKFWFSVLATFLLLSALPFDLSLRTRPGRPGFVRLLYGLPSQRAIEAERRGEVILGGCCIDSLYEPRWIFVW